MAEIYVVESKDGKFWISGFGITNRVNMASKFATAEKANEVRIGLFNPQGWLVKVAKFEVSHESNG